MKKYIAYFMVLAVGISCLAGCKKSGDTETTEKEKVVITEDTQGMETTELEGNNSLVARPSVNGKLQVVGTSLCDESGNPVQLRGVSTHGLAWFPEYVNEDCFSDLKSWGANVVRLAMYTHENGGYCTDGNKETLKSLVKSGVEYATNQDMYVIIDWHVLNENNPNTYIEDAKTFWEEMSKEYADSDNVIYEICNEPCGGTTWSDVKSYANTILPIIRENDSDAVVIVGTPTWSQDVDKAAADPITGYDNIMYALHFYAATHKADLRSKMTAAVDAGLPIFVSEYGICDASGNGAIDETEANTWVETMNSYGISYVCWNLANKNESSSIFLSNCSKTSGFTLDDLSEEGKWLYNMLHQAADLTTNQTSSTSSDETSQETGSTVEQTGNFEVTKTIENQWDSDGVTYYQYNCSIKNTGDAVSNWSVVLTFDKNITLSQSWNANYTVNGNTLIITNAEYNGNVAKAGVVSEIGFIISY